MRKIALVPPHDAVAVAPRYSQTLASNRPPMVIDSVANASGKKPGRKYSALLNTIQRRSLLALAVACGSCIGFNGGLHGELHGGLTGQSLSAQDAVALPYAYQGNQSVSIRKPSIDELAPIQSVDINTQRERLFNELAEEFETFDRLGSLVRRVSQLVKPSVIHIEAHKTENKGGARQSYDEAGSGVIIEALDGSLWVLTNRHVIVGAGPREILLRSSDGREFYPSKVVSDASTDVAVMRIDSTGLPAARLGDSEAIEIGDFVIAIGSPFGLSHSVTFGILSAKGRRDLSLGEQKIDLQDFFQTDAAINPGNSGGPLLNLRGEVIGLNTAIASSSGGSEGIGFAIPIDMAMRVADQLTRQGRLRRGYLGVTLDPDFTPADLAAANRELVKAGILSGALVKNVRPGSPAEAAHLQRGDIIVQFDGKTIESDDHLVARVGLTSIGKSTPMIIYRGGKRYRTEVSLSDLN